MPPKLLLEDVQLGDVLTWVDGAGFTTSSVVTADPHDGRLMVTLHLARAQISVKFLLTINSTVQKLLPR